MGIYEWIKHYKKKKNGSVIHVFKERWHDILIYQQCTTIYDERKIIIMKEGVSGRLPNYQ